MANRRRIYKQGNSKVISVPQHILDHLGIEVGDYFEISIISSATALLTAIPAERHDYQQSLAVSHPHQ